MAHKSDCALYNEPAMAAGPCNCGAPDLLKRVDDFHVYTDEQRLILDECAVTIRALRAEVKRLKSWHYPAVVGELYPEMEKELLRLRSALATYGMHKQDCQCSWVEIGGHCTCGFTEASK